MKVNGVTNVASGYYNNIQKSVVEKNKPAKGDTLQISNTARVYDKIDNFLNLNGKNRLDLSDLNDAEREEFFKMLNALIKKGIVGYEYLEVNGKKEKHFLTNEIGDERIYGARKWREKRDEYKFEPEVRK